MENLDIYEKIRKVPKEAQKQISGGRLKGMTDINPMWRIKKLTEQFGPCGVGWKPVIKKTWVDNEANPNGETIANVLIDLYIKVGGEWSEPIPGIGGSMYISKDKNGIYVDDECYKKAYTDALSVACKALGMGADVYWDKDPTKYTGNISAQEEPRPTSEQLEQLKALGVELKNVAIYYKTTTDKLTGAQVADAIAKKQRKINNAKEQEGDINAESNV